MLDNIIVTPAFLYWVANLAKEYLCDGRSICCAQSTNNCPFDKICKRENIKCGELGLRELFVGLQEIYEKEVEKNVL